MTKYQYRSLPSGNKHQFPEIATCLRGRGVRLEISRYRAGGALFRWPVEDTPKLPHDGEGNYFGTEETGFSIHHFGDEIAEEWREEFGGSDWEVVE